MANLYLDTPELKHHLSHPLMKRITELKRHNYAGKNKFDCAPADLEDATDSYDKILETVGEVCGDIVTPSVEGVNHEGPVCADNRVTYASRTARNLDTCHKAGLVGMTMPRHFESLNFPITPYTMAADIVSRSGAGFENLQGLQDCTETIYEFASEEQKQRYIARVCQDGAMSVGLTEPDAGSDL